MKRFIEKKTVLIPTENKSNIQLDLSNNKLGYFIGFFDDLDKSRYMPNHENSYIQFQYLYILSDEDIKENDWVIPNDPEFGFRPWQFKQAPCPLPFWGCKDNCKKIIASNNKELNLPDIPILSLDICDKIQNNSEIQVEMEIEVSSPCTCETGEQLCKCPFAYNDGMDILCGKRFSDGKFWHKKEELIVDEENKINII